MTAVHAELAECIKYAAKLEDKRVDKEALVCLWGC